MTGRNDNKGFTPILSSPRKRKLSLDNQSFNVPLAIFSANYYRRLQNFL